MSIIIDNETISKLAGGKAVEVSEKIFDDQTIKGLLEPVATNLNLVMCRIKEILIAEGLSEKDVERLVSRYINIKISKTIESYVDYNFGRELSEVYSSKIAKKVVDKLVKENFEEVKTLV